MPDFPSPTDPSLAEHTQTLAVLAHESKVWMDNVLVLLGELATSQTALAEIVDSLSQEVAELSANRDLTPRRAYSPSA